MSPEEPVVRDILGRCMVARIATLSRTGRPSVNPLYFIYQHGHIWLGTADWTLAARNAAHNPHVSLLFQLEEGANSDQLLRVSGNARVWTDREIVRTYGLRVVFKYLLPTKAIRNILAHSRQVRLQRLYSAQSAQKGKTCIIDVTPEHVELLPVEEQRC